VGGNPTLLRELVHLFLHDYPSHLTTLQDALRRGETDPVMRTAHSLQGAISTSSTLAATLISALARMGGAGVLEDASCVLPPLERELAGINTFGSVPDLLIWVLDRKREFIAIHEEPKDKIVQHH
jgi:hypothetical protein